MGKMRHYAGFFFGGLVWDTLINIDIIFVSHLNVWGTAITTFLITVLSILFYSTLIRPNHLDWGGVLVLALGSACGAALAVNFFM